MKISTALRSVKKHVHTAETIVPGEGSKDRQRFICIEARVALLNKEISQQMLTRIVTHISECLDGRVTLEVWVQTLSPHYRLSFIDLPIDERERQMQAFRHRWLDAMITDFEAKGD